jgi:hypothetical protein
MTVVGEVLARRYSFDHELASHRFGEAEEYTLIDA